MGGRSPWTGGSWDPAIPDFPGSKVELLVENVFSIWEATRAERLS